MASTHFIKTGRHGIRCGLIPSLLHTRLAKKTVLEAVVAGVSASPRAKT